MESEASTKDIFIGSFSGHCLKMWLEPRCSSGSVAMNWIAIGIAGSCFLGLVFGFQNAALEAHQNLPGECPATVSQIGIGGKSTAKTCRIEPLGPPGL